MCSEEVVSHCTPYWDLTLRLTHYKHRLLDEVSGTELLERLKTANHLLDPVNTGGFFGKVPSSLPETRPTFLGTWVLKDPNQLVQVNSRPTSRFQGRPVPRNVQEEKPSDPKPSPTSLIVVQIDWTEDEEGNYEKSTPRFYRLKEKQAGPKENMDVNLIELAESKAWHFGLESMTLMRKGTVSPALTAFANSVRMVPKYNPTSKTKFAMWSIGPSVKMVYWRLDKIYSFGIKKTGYRVEAATMWYPNQAVPCWGLTVRHRDWGLHLSELERLLEGDGAEWGDPIKKFIPEDGILSSGTDATDLLIKDTPTHGEGIRLLVSKLMQLSTLVNTAQRPSVPSLGAGLGSGILLDV